MHQVGIIQTRTIKWKLLKPMIYFHCQASFLGLSSTWQARAEKAAAEYLSSRSWLRRGGVILLPLAVLWLIVSYCYSTRVMLKFYFRFPSSTSSLPLALETFVHNKTKRRHRRRSLSLRRLFPSCCNFALECQRALHKKGYNIHSSRHRVIHFCPFSLLQSYDDGYNFVACRLIIFCLSAAIS
jgi:hypothetical protein